ncbi:MAG: hypothetical protein II743_01625 [Lachnospiraceae bacterium]|nr:hypothetical protein [Lachnospiraceae bacterium]
MQNNEILNQISMIRKLKMVNVYSLFDKDGPMTGILAYYQDKTINLCNADPLFPELFDKIVKTYELESPKNAIIVNEETKQVLDQANAFQKDDYEKLLSGYEEQPYPYYVPKAFHHVTLLPIVRYLLKMLYGDAKEEIAFDENEEAWFGKGKIGATIGEKHLSFPFQSVELQRDCFEVCIYHALMQGNQLRVKIAFEDHGVTISWRDAYFLYEGSLLLRVSSERAVLSNCFMKEEKIIRQSEAELIPKEGLKPTERVQKLTNGGDAEWLCYELPWGNKLFTTTVEGKDLTVYESQMGALTQSYATCRIRLTGENTKGMGFGCYAFRLYERDDRTEMHLLDMSYPRSGRYQENYAGKYFVEVRNSGRKR